MKKTVLMALFTVVIIGCNDKQAMMTIAEEHENDLAAEDSVTCIGFEEYDQLNDTAKKAEWLRLKGADICPDILYSRVENDHLIKNYRLNSARGAAPLKKSWKDIDTMTSQLSAYQKYVGFDIDPVTKEVKDVKLIDKFTNATPCYSVALFRSLAKRYGDHITFEFAVGTVNSKETVIINVIDGNKVISYYDYSDEPKSRKILI